MRPIVPSRMEAMVKSVLIFFCIAWLVGSLALGQERRGKRALDSSEVRETVPVNPMFEQWSPTHRPPPSFLIGESSTDYANLFFLDYPAGISRPSRLALSDKIDFATWFRLHDQKNPGLRTLQNVLGTVEVGAAGYMAYRFVKKHGLLGNK